MSNYNPLTNFTAKDSLTTGDPQKIIRGADFDAEFDSISTAVNSKADANNAALTGSSSAVNLDVTGTFELGGTAVTATATELNLLDGVTATTAELNQLDGNVFTADLTIPDKIIHAGDTNTAIRFPAADTVTVETDGTERMRIDSSGRVGIGITNPSDTLSIRTAAGIASVNLAAATTGSSEFVQIGGDSVARHVLAAGGQTAYVTSFEVEQGVSGAASLTNRASAPLLFQTSNSERMRIDASGNVGIGTTSPAYPLDVDGKIRTTDDVYLTNGSASQVRFSDSTDTNGYTIRANVSAVSDFGLFFEKLDGTDLYNLGRDDPHIWFSATGVERMRIDASGNVGIGTSSPVEKLNLYQASGAFGIRLQNATTGATINDGAFFTLNASSALEIGTDDNTPVQFFQNGSEQMRINTVGSVGIGTTTFTNKLTVVDSGNTCLFRTDGAATSVQPAIFYHSAASGNNVFMSFAVNAAFTPVGNIDYNRGAGLVRYNTTSDETLKNVIGDSDKSKSCEVLSSTKIREYAWKDDPDQKSQIGVIAQELYETFKGAVSVGGEQDDGTYRPWAVDKTAFTFHLVAGWQEHQRLIKEQQDIINDLRARVAELEAKA